jgi:hypothetical protein
MAYQKRHRPWSVYGTALLGAGVSEDKAARADDELQDRWAADAEAEQAEVEAERKRAADKAELDRTEQRLRIRNAARRAGVPLRGRGGSVPGAGGPP